MVTFMGSHFSGSKEEVKALDTYIKLVRSADSINSATNLYLSKVNLTESQFLILDALFHIGDLTQKDLAEKLLKSGGNITMVVDNLEARDFVKRNRGKEDRRKFFVHITNKGEKQIKNVLPGFVKLITNVMKKLDSPEQKELQRLCKKIGIRN